MQSVTTKHRKIGKERVRKRKTEITKYCYHHSVKYIKYKGYLLHEAWSTTKIFHMKISPINVDNDDKTLTAYICCWKKETDKRHEKKKK